MKAILPKAALRVEEEAWNAYPYTKMRTTCPFVEKFFVDVETYYLPDAGQQVINSEQEKDPLRVGVERARSDTQKTVLSYSYQYK